MFKYVRNTVYAIAALAWLVSNSITVGRHFDSQQFSLTSLLSHNADSTKQDVFSHVYNWLLVHEAYFTGLFLGGIVTLIAIKGLVSFVQFLSDLHPRLNWISN